MLAGIRAAFSQKSKPSARGSGTEIPVGQVSAGCLAGVIMADGTVVQLEGEPPVAESSGWGDVSGLLCPFRDW
jgi:hypothetical protein